MGHAVQGHDIGQVGLLDALVHDVPVGLYGSPALEELRLQHLFAPASLIVEENKSVHQHPVDVAPDVALPRVVLLVVYRYRALVDVLVWR